MYVIAVIGMRGQGKTTFVKNMIKGKHNYIFDVQNEYQDFNPAPHLDRALFIQECMNYIDTYCVFEEATGFFKGRLDETTDRMILGARHTRNRYIFNFHSINAVPPGIMFMLNYVVLFKTGDMLNHVQRKYPALLRGFVALQNKPKFSKLIIPINA